MKSSNRSVNRSARRKQALFPVLSSAIILLLVCAANWFPASEATAGSSARNNEAGKDAAQQVTVVPSAGDTCAGATVINPAGLPFSEDSTTVGANNDIDPGGAGCVPAIQGPGPDVVYSFTPSVTDVYTIGATPFSSTFDLSLYVITNCANPAGTCVAGSNTRDFGKSEFVTPMLNSGTQYFIVVDGATSGGGAAGPFHFSLRRGTPSNDACASPIVIQPNRLPFNQPGTTFGAHNDFNPGLSCLDQSGSSTGLDVVYQFTPVDPQVYRITVTPIANYDTSVYVVDNCATLNDCHGMDQHGGGGTEVLLVSMVLGVTYSITVDGNTGDAGDFTIKLEPTIPKAPNAPSNLVATAISASRVDLSWNDNSNNEDGFLIQRSLDGFNFTEIGTVGSNVTMFSDTTVAASTTYFYRVAAFNNLFGQSDFSNVADATTPTPPPPPVPVISVTPDLVDFGSVGPTLPADQTVTVSNVGGADLVITAISDPAAPFSIVGKPSVPLTIGPAANIMLTIRFRPTAAQLFASSFAIQSNDGAHPSVTVNLRGVGTAAPVPNLEVNPPVFDFPGGSSSTAAEFKNSGDADLLIATVLPPKTPFSLTGLPPLPITLRPGQSFPAAVSFSPSTIGVFDGSFTVVSNDPDFQLFTIRLHGTSTTTNEALKLRAPTLATVIAGASNTLTVLAANGTNSDIRLQASAVSGGLFTDRGNGKGDLVVSPAAGATGDVLVTYTARDSANRVKSIQGVITILAASATQRVQVTWTLASASPNPPTDVMAIDLFITPLAAASRVVSLNAVVPADAPGLVGYLVHRSQTVGVQAALSNVAGIVSTGQNSFIDNAPAATSSSQVFFYSVTALYGSGTESAGSNETSSAPRMVGLKFKGKTVRFNAANSNVAVGAVLVADGRETFALERDGDLIRVNKDSRSTPGGLRPRDIFTSPSSHGVEVRNPNGASSGVVTLTR